MIIGLYIQRLFLYRVTAVFGITFALATFLELASVISQPDIMQNISTFIKYTLCKALIFNDDAMFFIVTTGTMLFANHISSTSQLPIILLYRGSPMFILKKVCYAISLVALLYVTIFHGFVYHKVTAFMNEYRKDYAMKDNVPQIWIKNIDVTNPDDIHGDIYLLTNVKIYKYGFIVDGIVHYKISKGSLEKYTKYSKAFITNTPTKEIVFFSLHKTSIARNVISNVKIQDIYSSFSETNGKILNQSTYSEIKKIIKKKDLPAKTVNAAYMYLISILQAGISMVSAAILVLAYSLNTSSRNTALNFVTIKVLSYTIIIYTVIKIVKMLYPYSIINYTTALMLTLATIFIFTGKFIKKYY